MYGFWDAHLFSYNSIFNPSTFSTPVIICMAIGIMLLRTSAPQYLRDYDSGFVGAFRDVHNANFRSFHRHRYQLGCGCTSGHKLCGLGRGSMRSVVVSVTVSLVAVVVSINY